MNANVILYNSSVYKKLILCYILNTILSVFVIYITYIGPYDFRDAETADGIAESSHKNGIYSLTRYLQVWMN